MNCELDFGVHKGKTYEWVFFNAPSYATWLYENNILRTRHDFNPLERHYFDELYARASNMAGTCEICKTKPITRKAMYFNCGECVTYRFCETCKTPYLRKTYFSSLSMLDFGTWVSRFHPRIFHALAEEYTGQRDEYSQEEMEEFFRKDSNFKNATPNFFSDWEKEVESS